MPEISRRTLIAGTAAVAATSAARAKGRPPLPDDQKLGVAIVGLGRLSLTQLIPGLKHAYGVKLAAVVSGHPDKAAKVAAENGLPADAIYNYENYDRIAQDPRIDIVYIVLPNSMHAEYTIRAFKAGKHVLCEKPMATTPADCERMIAAGKAAKRHLMIAYRCHYEPHNLEAMRRIRSRKYGKPRLVVTEMGRQSSLSDPPDVWRLDMKMSGGGSLTDMGVYGVNGMRYLLNEEPVEVRAWANTDRSDPRFKDTEDLIAWQFRFPSGALGNGSTSFSYGGCMKWDVFCENARLRADPGAYYNGNKLNIFSHPDQGEVPIADIDQFAREMDWMGDVVRGKVPMVSPGEEGLQDVRLMQAILQSVAQGGAPVKTDWGYKRAVDPAAVVDVPAPRLIGWAMLALIALVAAALFTGAACYVSFAEHPARLKLDDRSALAQWKPAYARGTIMQAGLALIGGLAGIAAWYRWMSVWPWLVGGMLMLANIAWTFAVIWQTNGKLKATPLDEAGPETRALLVLWGQLHLGRTILGALATAFITYGMT